ncbi:hypothetical protein C2S52_005485 [Perilla frutescens var. hirtella]|nr:hypothetical protein C2S52_005485 [Perilla frutescens var. hirtella]
MDFNLTACTLLDIPDDANNCYAKYYDDLVQNHLDSPMTWVGMYVAAASAACSLAMAADAFNGFRSKKLWIPCKYFSLNAFSLTVLAVAMKLPVDITSNMKGINDKLARISSLVLISTAMGNFTTSLGSLENNEIILNSAALCILVTTIAGNVCIHLFQSVSIIYYDGGDALGEEIGCSITMLVLLVTFFSSAVMVPSARRYIESKYNEIHKNVSKKQVEWGEFSGDELRIKVKKYWVMAASGSPQFVMARSSISCTSGLMCLLLALTLVEAHVRLRLVYKQEKARSSGYRWTIDWILFVQSIGVALGTVAPLLRWFVASWFRNSEIGPKSFRDEFKIEKYWTLLLVEWRDRSLPSMIQHRQCRKLLHDSKVLLLNICIGVQILLVAASKLVLLISAKFGNAVFLCFCHTNRPDSTRGSKSRDGTELDFSSYVLLLEGEAKLPEKILKNICNDVDKLIRIGEKDQPKNLMRLLKKSATFNGLRQFDSDQVLSLQSQEPPNCWSLPVVTLTSISIAVTNLTVDKVNQLLASVREGLSIVKLIEKTLDRNGELESIRKAADMVWVGVDLYGKWEEKDLRSTSVRGRTHRETLQNLANIAEKTVKSFTSEAEDILIQNPLNWPVQVIAANSMYRITQTILVGNIKDNEHQTGDELFESLSIIIADILAACLTNLVQVITLKCHRNTINERKESVGRAAILLGECKEILEILQQHELPSLDLEKAASIDQWRASMAHA